RRRTAPGEGRIPPGVVGHPAGVDEDWRSRGVQGGVAARRSAAEPDELRIPPWVVGHSAGVDDDWRSRGVQGGVAARRSAAEPDELRIPPGSSDTPQEWTTSGKLNQAREESQNPALIPDHARRSHDTCGFFDA